MLANGQTWRNVDFFSRESKPPLVSSYQGAFLWELRVLIGEHELIRIGTNWLLLANF